MCIKKKNHVYGKYTIIIWGMFNVYQKIYYMYEKKLIMYFSKIILWKMLIKYSKNVHDIYERYTMWMWKSTFQRQVIE